MLYDHAVGEAVSYVSREVLLRTPWRFLVGTLSLAVSSTQVETYLIWDDK